MRIFLACVTVATATSIGTGGQAAEAAPEKTGFELGGRISYAVPFGSVAGETPEHENYAMRYWFASQVVPLQLDVGYRVAPRVLVGGYFSYGTVQVGDVCDSDEFDEIACDSRDVRAGAQVIYHFSRVGENAGWVGAGIGYEWLTIRQGVSETAGNKWDSYTFHGLEANLQAGYDFAATEQLRIGPYVLTSFGRFSGTSYEFEHPTDSGRVSTEFDEHELHGWMMFGFKVSVGPF